MNKYDVYIYLIFAIKIGFVLMAVSHIILKAKGDANSYLDNKIVYWKEIFEFTFIFLMAILLIYLFNPKNGKNVIIEGDTKILLYLFGFVLLLTGQWGKFIHEANLLKPIIEIVGLE
jgi:hypothetical protein